MPKILITVNDQLNKDISSKAKVLGLSKSAFLRHFLSDHFYRNTHDKRSQNYYLIKALIPVLADALGRTQGVSEENVVKLTKILTARFERETGAAHE